MRTPRILAIKKHRLLSLVVFGLLGLTMVGVVNAQLKATSVIRTQDHTIRQRGYSLFAVAANRQWVQLSHEMGYDNIVYPDTFGTETCDLQPGIVEYGAYDTDLDTAPGFQGTTIDLPHLYPSSTSQAALPVQSELSFHSTVSASVASAAEIEPGLRLVRASEQGIILDIVTPALQVDEGESADGPCSLLSVEGYGGTDASGWPRLPARGVMLGIPPNAELSLAVLEVEITDLGVGYNVCPVPQPVMATDPGGELEYEGMETVRDPNVYAGDSLYPRSPVEVVATGQIRSQRVAQLQFQPFQYNPATGQLVKYDRIQVAVEYHYPGGGQPLEGVAVPEGSFEEVLRDSLLNYKQAQSWRLAPQISDSSLSTAIAPEQPAYKVFVDQDGLYQVTPADLVAAGIADIGSIDPRTFRLDNTGQEVDIYVAGEEDGSFAGNDFLLFYGEQVDSRFTDRNVYWLTWGRAKGQRMAEADGAPSGTAPVPDYFHATVRREDNLSYQSRIPSGEGGDHWFEGYVFASAGPASDSYTVTLQNLVTEPYSATLRGKLYGYSYFSPTPDHHTRVHLNGHLVDDLKWDGWQDYEFEKTVPSSYLIEGTNLISLELPFDLESEVLYDIVFVDWFEIDYRRTYTAEGDVLAFVTNEAGAREFQVTGFSTADVSIFDVTVPSSPIRILDASVEDEGNSHTIFFEQVLDAERHYLTLTPTRWLSPAGIEADVPSDLRSTANGADYLLLTHGDFYTEVQSLAAHRTAQELRTKVIDVSEIYDEFSYGVFDPGAIRDFLAYAYGNWVAPAPAYVLLVGDGNYDFKDAYGHGESNYVPPYLAYADPWMGETAADNRFVCVSGDDAFPDMHLGRLPVKTPVEAATAVRRILDYEQNPPEGDWRSRLLFVSDNADSAGDFAALSEELASEFVPSTYVVEPIYYQVTHLTVEEAKADLLQALEAGQLLVNYIGHASPSFWAFEHLLDRSDLPGLANADMLPLAVPMTCLDGYYLRPSTSETDNSCIAETFVRTPGAGAIASFSPTGLGIAMGHEFLDKGLFTALFYDGVRQLGPATTAAKFYLYSNTAAHRELLDTYLLFGDPALPLAEIATGVPSSLSLTKAAMPPDPWMPGQTITYTLAYTNTGPAIAHNVVLSDRLPSGLIKPTFTSTGSALTLRPGTTFVWDVADLAGGEGGVVTITAWVDASFKGVLTNTAHIATTSPDDNLMDNWAQHVALAATEPYWCYLPLVLRTSDLDAP